MLYLIIENRFKPQQSKSNNTNNFDKTFEIKICILIYINK